MDDKFPVKQEPTELTPPPPTARTTTPQPISVIELSSSDSDSSSSEDESGGGRSNAGKRRKLDGSGVVLPDGFLDPLPHQRALPLAERRPEEPVAISQYRNRVAQFGSKQFWKAGDYYEDSAPPGVFSASSSTVGMDHVRVHPKFLHSNATSHKWALGAFAELLDNSLDEVVYGATFVNVDMIESKKDGSRMLLIEDNGGGMDPDKMRQCMSLGYSAKSKMANVIGQYGNGFKTSTMRLGADVIVFSRSRGKYGKSPTQSIGMLSYTFLRGTRKEDIVVPMLDYVKAGQEWNKLMRSSQAEWDINVGAIVQWSPYASEDDLFHQFHMMGDQGTRIIIYNLWEDDQGQLELDFDADSHDIQIRGVNRDEKKIEMAKQFPNSRHFLTYRHSLRSYASILYLRVPHGFRFVLRGKDVAHHNIINDMFLTQEITYKPQPSADGGPKDSNMIAIVTIGFVKDAKDHIDVQGFNVYHKNRLIKPFWRVWNAAGSDGRGVIGVLEANFVEPAHDKQGFERTTVLARLETRLIQMQKTFWSSLCHKIGYAPRGRQKKLVGSEDRESSPEYSPYQSSKQSKHSKTSTSTYTYKGNHSTVNHKQMHGKDSVPSPSTNGLKYGSRHVYSNGNSGMETNTNYGNNDVRTNSSERHLSGTATKDSSVQKSLQSELSHNTNVLPQNSDDNEVEFIHASNGVTGQVTPSHVKEASAACNGNGHAPVHPLEVENSELKERLKKMEESFSLELESIREKNRSLEAVVKGVSDLESSGQSLLKMQNNKLMDSLKQMEESFSRDLQFEKDRCKSLEAQLKESEKKIEEMNHEQEALIDIFQEERNRRDGEEEKLRKKLKEASVTIQQLLDKVKHLEMVFQNHKPER